MSRSWTHSRAEPRIPERPRVREAQPVVRNGLLRSRRPRSQRLPTVSVTVQTTTVGTISNTATVSGHQTDPNTTNNSSTEQTVVQVTKIAYIADGVPDTSVQGIWTMNPNGTNNVRIVEGGASDPVLSPDRQKLVYSKMTFSERDRPLGL